MHPDPVEFLRLPDRRPTYATGAGICTTEIFQGFNFINDHPVPDDPCSIDLHFGFRSSGLLVLSPRARYIRGAPVAAAMTIRATAG